MNRSRYLAFITNEMEATTGQMDELLDEVRRLRARGPVASRLADVLLSSKGETLKENARILRKMHSRVR